MKESFQEFVNKRFSGLLKYGSHEPNGEACALEAYSQYIGIPWTDNPSLTLGIDFRNLNDARWSSDQVRSTHMIPLIEAYKDWKFWDREKQNQVVKYIVIETVKQIISNLPNLNLKIKQQCLEVTDLQSAKIAAAAAAAAAAADAADAAGAAYAAAGAAANAADAAAANAAGAADKTLITCCHILIDAVNKS